MIDPCTKDMIDQAKKCGKSGKVQNIVSLNPNQWKVSKEEIDQISVYLVLYLKYLDYLLQILVNHYEINQPMMNFTSGGQ